MPGHYVVPTLVLPDVLILFKTVLANSTQSSYRTSKTANSYVKAVTAVAANSYLYKQAVNLLT